MFLLFVVRSADDPSTGLLTWKDAEQQSPWNAMLLVTGAVAMTDALAQFGFVEFMGNIVRSIGIAPSALPYVAAWSTAITTNFISGYGDGGALRQHLRPGGCADWLQPGIDCDLDRERRAWTGRPLGGRNGSDDLYRRRH